MRHQFTKGLLIDWLGPALAGKGAPQVEAIARFAAAMGQNGPSTFFTSRRKTSRYFAAVVLPIVDFYFLSGCAPKHFIDW